MRSVEPSDTDVEDARDEGVTVVAGDRKTERGERVEILRTERSHS
jgi:hypothetical protein